MIRTGANGVMMSSLLVSIHMVQNIPLVELLRHSGTLALEIPERGGGGGGGGGGRNRGVRNSFACIYIQSLYVHIHVCSVSDYIAHCRKIANNITNDKSLPAQHI